MIKYFENTSKNISFTLFLLVFQKLLHLEPPRYKVFDNYTIILAIPRGPHLKKAVTEKRANLTPQNQINRLLLGSLHPSRL